jgi:hypothetical protein
MWTQFWDMHSGGRQKLEWARIYIEAPQDEAAVIFQNRFGRNPHRVTCTCCGPDYSIDCGETLAKVSAYHRNCAWVGEGYAEHSDPKRSYAGPYLTVDEYIANSGMHFIFDKDIKPEERSGNLRAEGYVWAD